MLEVRNLSVSYGRHRALESAGITVGKGEICVILGANGAGKSTLLKAVAGMVHADSGGDIVMNGRSIARMKPHRIVEEGIALVPEGRGIFADLTVAENLQLGAFANRARADEAATLRRVYELFPRLAERRRQVARTMSGGEQQMVAIGRALMSRPEILMLDEPSLGLSPLLTQELFRSLTAVAATGVGILLVEQNAKQSLKIAGRGYLIENGHVTGENSAKALMNDPAVINAYLGGARRQARPQVVLPPSIALPAGIEAIGRAMSDLAGRAGRIQQAFIRTLRRDEALPSAFVGRYDPKAGGDPWNEVAAVPQQAAKPVRALSVPADARRASDNIAGLAARATERHRAHVVASRLSTARPTAFGSPRKADDFVARTQPVPEVISAVSAASFVADVADAAAASSMEPRDLARRAAARLSGQLARARARRPVPSAFAPPPWTVEQGGTKERADVPVSRHVRGHSLIGHNSAGIVQEESEEIVVAKAAVRDAKGKPDVVAPVAQPSARQREHDTIASLVARAASVHTAHVAQGRKKLSAFVLPAQDATMSETIPTPDKSAAKKNKKRKKHKET